MERELLRFFEGAHSFGRHPCVVWVALFLLDLAALWLGYKALTSGLSRGGTIVAFALVPVAIALTFWFLMRVAASIMAGWHS